jgi:hypothetical protein
MEAVSSRQLGDLQGLTTPEVALAPHRWPQDFRTEFPSDFEKDDVELQTCAFFSFISSSHPYDQCSMECCHS